MIFDFETEPLQFCPECVLPENEINSECFRCDGDGIVPIYDPLADSFKVRVYASGHPSAPKKQIRIRPVVTELPPRIELP